MLKLVLSTAVIGLVAGLTPSIAQTSNCQNWCLQNRCAHGAPNQTLCMEKCVAFCEKKNKKGKGKS
jgi:hypothetical protein